MTRSMLRIALAVTLLGSGVPVFADEPGPGGSKAVVPVTGEQVYRTVCQACHMADGKGGSGAATIPALANNPRLASAAYPIVLVAKGRGAMPWFTDMLSPAQTAGVVTYIRTHFGNNYSGVVTPADVAKFWSPPPPGR